MATSKEQHRKDLKNCVVAIAKRAAELEEMDISAVLYCLTGCIQDNIDGEHARISQELSMYLLISKQLQQSTNEDASNNSGSVTE